MKAAFGLIPAFPPSGPRIVTGHDRLRALNTADAGIVAVMHFVIRHFVQADVSPDIGPRPPDERIHLDELKDVIPLDWLGMGPGRRLFPSNTGNPRIESTQHTRQRFDFSQLAALVWVARPQGRPMLFSLPF